MDYKLWAMTMIDPATGWFEIVETHTKTAEHIGKLLDRTWFSRYPRPQFCIFDNGNEFLGEKFKEMIESYHLTGIPTTVKNPQASLVERVHQTLRPSLFSNIFIEKSSYRVLILVKSRLKTRLKKQ